MKKLKTMEEYNEQRSREYMSHYTNLGTGVACPQCGDEMKLSNPTAVLTTFPPQKAVHCNTCKFKSCIVA